MLKAIGSARVAMNLDGVLHICVNSSSSAQEFPLASEFRRSGVSALGHRTDGGYRCLGVSALQCRAERAPPRWASPQDRGHFTLPVEQCNSDLGRQSATVILVARSAVAQCVMQNVAVNYRVMQQRCSVASTLGTSRHL